MSDAPTVGRLARFGRLCVRTEDGTKLGHVFELRSPGEAETEPTRDSREISCLLCGRLGLFERLGWRERDATTVPWSAVISVGTKEILVRGSADDYKRIRSQRAGPRMQAGGAGVTRAS